jgi:hypothetical protein
MANFQSSDRRHFNVSQGKRAEDWYKYYLQLSESDSIVQEIEMAGERP